MQSSETYGVFRALRAGACGPRLARIPVNVVFRDVIDLFVRTMEMAAVLVIVVALAHATGRYLLDLGRHRADAYKQLKTYIGKALLLALEVLIAADIVETVVLDRTLDNVLLLALLVLVRTFLSWSVVVEIEGHWPWHARGAE